MPRLLFLTWNGAGNQPPAVALAQALQRRGHEITFAGYENQRRYFVQRGFRFVLLGRSSSAWRDETPERMFDVKLHTAWSSSDHLLDVPRLIEQERCIGLVVDCLMFGALAAAELSRLPTVALVHSAPGALAPPKGRFESQLMNSVNRVRRQAGLVPVGSLWEAWARFPSLSNSIRQLDPSAERAPLSFSYLGPMAEDVPPSGWKSPWPADERRPLVLVSFSTGPYWDQGSRISRVLDAVRDRDCRAIVTAGETRVDPASVPGNAVVVPRVPHDEVLPGVAATVTHAGHGTVMASLKHGVPLLSLPNLAADQPILAARVAELGCGLSLDGDRATPYEIGMALDRLLAEPSHAANARRLAEAISGSPGTPAAVLQLERLIAGR
jgi:MGT family glycosyltransferase